MRTIIEKGTTYQVGTSAEENWRIILAAEKDHYWVHLEGQPSAHVIIEIDKPTDDELRYAGELCKQQTFKTVKQLAAPARCVSTVVHNIKLGSKAGEVYFKSEKERKLFVA